MIYALETTGLGKRYGDTWALRDCSVKLPVGCLAGLVGPNGAGKTTLLHLAMGLIEPSMGSVRVLGYALREEPQSGLEHIGFVAQERPLYRSFTVRDMLKWGSKLNPRWDDGRAKARLDQLQIPLERRISKLSGGQQAQVALIMALAKQPDLLILDEPVANLDPLARQEFLQALAEVVSEGELTILFSTHIIADLDRICNYLVILSASRVQVSSPVEQFLQSHRKVTVQHQQIKAVTAASSVIQARYNGQQSTLLVHSDSFVPQASWQVDNATLEELILAYLAQPTQSLSPDWEQGRSEVSL